MGYLGIGSIYQVPLTQVKQRKNVLQSATALA